MNQGPSDPEADDIPMCRIASNVNVFDPVASAECKRRGLEDSPASRREVLGTVLYDIRFPAMNVQDFADHAATSGRI